MLPMLARYRLDFAFGIVDRGQDEDEPGIPRSRDRWGPEKPKIVVTA